MNRTAKTILQSTAAACALMCAAPTAWAQSTGGETSASAEVGEVVVTGSRIKRDGYDQPTPVAVATVEALLAAAPSDIATGLNQLPQFASSGTRSRCCGAGSQGNFLNLRALGPNRTLVLLDGDRVTPTTETGIVDVNLLPEMLVQRVDVVTGGASAAYGSDAVSGVVNYIIDRKFTGLKLEAQGGINTYGDDKSVKLGAAAGVNFAEGRGRAIASVQHYRTDGVFSLTQFPGSSSGHYYSGNGSAAAPYRAVYGAVNSSLTNGGIITTAAGVPIADATNPLAGLIFLPGGTTRQAVVGATFPGSSAIFRSSGDGSVIDTAGPFASIDTNKLFARFEFDITDSLTFSTRLNAAESENFQPFGAEREATSTAYTIFRDNAFLPANVAALMDQRGISSFRLGRINREFGRQSNDYYNNTFDIAAGLDGKIGDAWTWQAGYSHGETKLHGILKNNVTLPNLFAAADAVRDPATGAAVCRVALTNPGVAPGCVPINLFGEGSPSQAALNYVVGQSEQRVKNTQDLVTVSAQGTVWTLPAGDVSVAVGAEYRERSLVETADNLSTSQMVVTGIRGVPTTFCPTATTCRFGAHGTGNFGVADATDNVKELFGEAVVPLLKDMPFAKNLELNGAFRRTDYKYSGVANTWKVGANYEPFEGLRFRGTRSRDIRAPNLFDLFQGPVVSFVPGVVDRITGRVNVTATVLTQGNPNLQPEKADTLTLGVVYQPTWLSGFSGSVDYYDIDIKGALAPITAQQTIDACAQGDQEACARITRDPAGNISQIISQNINVASRKTRGIDFDLTYRREVGPGQLTAHAVATRLLRFRDANNGVVTDYTGNISVLDVQNAGPKWRGNLSLNYEAGNWSLFVQERILGEMNIRPGAPTAANYVDSSVRGVYYTDVTVTYKLPEKGIEVFGTVNNLFNETPPFIPSQLQPGLALPTNFNFYGWELRYFTGGVRMKF
jgi:outer membrane receptor protein involved in Fe transport